MWEELFLLYWQLLVNCGICLSEKHLCSYSYFLVFQNQKQKKEGEEAQKQKKANDAIKGKASWKCQVLTKG